MGDGYLAEGKHLWKDALAPEQVCQCALLISGSPHGVSAELLKTLKCACSYVVAVDSGADWAYKAGLDVDLLIGDFDSIDPEAFRHYRFKRCETIAYNSYKDETDLEIALAEIRERGFNLVVGTNVLGGRIDHLVASAGAFMRSSDLAPLVVDENEFIIFLSSDGNRRSIGLDMFEISAGDIVSIVPIGGAAVVTTTGLEWELKGEELFAMDSRGISNIVQSGDAVITADEGNLLVILIR